ncbi:MAG TPA: hypothetical protein VI728_10875 [Syntrophales bacterium]|nr:hypothetical protein [Syntrophales bacterium]
MKIGFLRAQDLFPTRRLLVALAVLCFLFRYRERKGYPYSVEKPASVAFDVHLIRVSDGIVAWRGAFDKTQSSLMENILQIASSFKTGGRWLTAKELTEEGVSEMLKTFPGIE